MRSPSKLKQSRAQWKHKASLRGNENRYLRKELRRVKTERDTYKKRAQQAQSQLKAHPQPDKRPASRSKADLVFMAVQLFLVARIGFRAVSRVLAVLGPHLGIAKAPCPQSIINWVMRLSMVRVQAASSFTGSTLSQAPFANGLIWMIDVSIGLGTGQMLAVLALDARHHQLSPAAPSLGQVYCVAVSVAASWTGETIARFLQRIISVLGRPAAYLKDGGNDLQKAVRLLGERGLPSLSIDDISHVAATLLKRHYQHHPLLATFLSACGRVSGKLKQTILACLAPPTVQTKARFMNVHRLVTWADRLLRLSPAGRASNGSTLAKLRTCLDQLPSCKALIKRFREDALPLLECQKILKNQGLSHRTLTQCEPLIEAISSSAVRRDFATYLQVQLRTATTLGLAEVGLPISSDPIESLFGLAKQHGVGEIKDVNRIALRLPALCGTPTRAEAQQIVEMSDAQHKEITARLTSLTQQRREVLPHPDCLETLGRDQAHAYVELLPGAKNRANDQGIINISGGYKEVGGPKLERQEEHCRPEMAVL
jgi:hypothetical protein